MDGSMPSAIFLGDAPCRSETHIPESRAKAILGPFCALKVAVNPRKTNKDQTPIAEDGAIEELPCGADDRLAAAPYHLTRAKRLAASSAFSLELNADTRK